MSARFVAEECEICGSYFRVRTIYIKFIGTHNEYDRVDLEDL
ncbi:MAG: hypothetical protein EOO05_15370 [Chitinophagaceae bacterium]|nr:MAG: hypothetical protein EOO05_15370 [Chitinophagaceae bacterium]